MPLVFKTESLIAAAQSVLDGKERATKEHQAAVAKFVAANRAKWVTQHKSDVIAFRDYLTRCIRNDQPPTFTDVKVAAPGLSGRYGDVSLYQKPSESDVPKPDGFHARTADLPGLLALLKAHQEPTVTPSVLKELGFDKAVIANLFRDAAMIEGAQKGKAK